MDDYPSEYDVFGCDLCWLDECICETLPSDAIWNIEDLAGLIGVVWPSQIAKALFKGTTCGISFQYNERENWVSVAGYAEGSDVECEEHRLRFPFALENFWAAVDNADIEGCDEWELANKEVDECID